MILYEEFGQTGNKQDFINLAKDNPDKDLN